MQDVFSPRADRLAWSAGFDSWLVTMSVNRAAVIASLVSVGAVLGLQTVQETRRPALDSGSAEMAPLIRANVESIANLKSELIELRKQLASTEGATSGGVVLDGDAETAGLAKRLDKMEHTLAELSAPGPLAGSKTGAELENKLTQVTQLAAGGSSFSYDQSARAEIDFEKDSGVPLGDLEETIGDALYTAEGIDISGMDCRDTICKVTYSKSGSLRAQGAGDGGYEIVDQLAQATNGREVEVRYGSDPAGKKVMYIQVR